MKKNCIALICVCAVIIFVSACRELREPTRILTPAITPTVVIRVNCGRQSDCCWCGLIASHTDSSGRFWNIDQSYIAGSWGHMNGVPGANSDNIINITPDTDDVLYQFGRADTSGNSLTYRFTVPNGDYIVGLYFCETYWNSAGERVFDVFINGTRVMDDIDILAAAGGKMYAISYSFGTTATLGYIDINAIASVDYGFFSGVEILSNF